jgi:hypothetical protein
MESNGLLPCTQEPTTGPYLEPDYSNPYHPFCFSKIQFNILWVFPVVSFFLDFPPKPCIYSFAIHSNAVYMPCIFLDLIILIIFRK